MSRINYTLPPFNPWVYYNLDYYWRHVYYTYNYWFQLDRLVANEPFQIEYTPRGPILVPVRNEQVAHLNDLVQHQRKQNGKVAPKKPNMITIPTQAANTCSDQKTYPKINNNFYESTKTDDNKPIEGCELNEKLSEKSDLIKNTLSDIETFSGSNSISSEVSYDTVINKDLSNKEETASNSLILNEMARTKSPSDSSGSDKVSEKMKNNFRLILQEHPRGISANKLCAAYKEKFGYPLVVQDLGFTSVRELILSLPDIFNIERTKSSLDWIIHDATINPKKKPSNDYCDHSKWIPNSVINNISKLVNEHPDGINVDDVLHLYQMKFGVRIDVKKMGFENVGSFLSNCSDIQFRISDNVNYVIPKSKKRNLFDEKELSDSKNALPSFNDMAHLWKQYFKEEFCDPTCDFKQFVIIEEDQFRTRVADVHSPDYVYLQPVDYGDRLSTLMFELNKFYDDVESDYVMPINVMKPGLVCCAKFAIDNTWYRAKIISITKNGFSISYVDYGTILHDVKPSDIRFLHKKFLADPIHAIRSRLYNLIPTNGQKYWPVETNVFLFNLVHQNVYYANVVSIDRSYPMLDVMLIDTSGVEDVNINDVLMKENHATSAALEEVYIEKNETFCENCNKKDWLDLVPESFLKALYKILPVWLIENPFLDVDGIRNEFRAMEDYFKNGLNVNDLVCCPSHLTRAMFFSDPEEISNIWREILVKHNREFIKSIGKSVTSLTSFEFRCRQSHSSFCDRYLLHNSENGNRMESSISHSPDLPRTIGTRLSDISRTVEPVVLPSFQPSRPLTVKNVNKFNESRKNVEADDSSSHLIFPKEKDSTQLGDIKTKDRKNKRSSDIFNNSNKTFNTEDNGIKHERCSEFLNLTRESDRFENNHTPNSSISRIFSKRSGPAVRELQITEQKGEGKFVFEMELAPGLVLVLVKIINVVYVVTEQIIRDFARGMPSVLYQHRSNKLAQDPENITIDPDSHPSIYRNLKCCGLITRANTALLIPIDKAGNLLRTLLPHEKQIALAFDKLAHQYKCNLSALIDETEAEDINNIL
ncbi:hypothetical protein O3M35_003522 [Rhynocoris fuscipes]|uniref:Tudor domain-containing protein 5 n=1 Tax=Rhynocoris fuscipes TaxID=488301 RepID=A0AAW1CMS1_9HEMI